MAQSIEIIGLKEVQQLIKEMPEVGKKTVSRAMNRTATHVKTNVSTKVREKSTIKAAYAKAQITVPSKATVSSLNTRVVVSGKKVKLIGYQARQTKKGVNARIFKSGPLKLRPRAFIATMKSGHKGVFWREFADKSSKRLVPRLGITELTDYSVPGLVNDDRVWNDVQSDADEFLQKQIESNLAFYMGNL